MSPIATIIDMRHRLLARLLVLVFLTAFHQPMKGEVVDSLYRAFLSTATANKARVADDLFAKLHDVQVCDTLLHYNKLGKEALADAKLHYLMSEFYFDSEQFEQSLEAGKRAEALLEHINDLSFKSDVMSTLANTQFRLDDYDDALVSLLGAYKIDRQLGNDELISNDLNTLAAIYLAVQQPRMGIYHIEKAIALERKLGRPNYLAIRLGMASELYLMDGDTDKALKTIKEAYDIDLKDGREEKAAIRQSQMGAVLEKKGQLDDARSLIEKALATLEKAQNTYSIAVCHNQLGGILQKQGQRAEAIKHYKQALELSIQCGSPKQERNAEHGLWETMREDNPTVAMLHLERYATLSDSLRNRITSLQMKVMDATMHDVEQSEEIETAMRERRILTWAGSLLGLMLIITAIGLFYSWRRSRRALQFHCQSQELHSHFLSNIAHELHTPLTAIMSAGEQLSKSTRTSHEENERLGKMIVTQSDNILGIVNQLIEIEEVESDSDKLIWKDGDIVLFTRLLVNNFSEEAQQHKVKLEFTCPSHSLMVKFVPDHLRKIIHSLLFNAIKYTSGGGYVTVKLTPLDDNKMRFIIADTGKGIPPDEQDRIFEPFTQGDNAVGTSLSLSLTNQLVKALNGDISVDSKPGQGTTFTIVLPVQSSAKAPFESRNNVAALTDQLGDGEKSLKPLVFIVESDDIVAQFTASHLRDDYALRMLTDGQEAYDNAQTLIPDLIVTSIILPTMDGKELIRKVRSHDELKHIPIIALTSTRGEQERISCLEAGANAVLVKPFNSDELKLEARHLIERQAILHERFVRSIETVPDKLIPTLSKEDQQFMNKLIDAIHALMAKQEISMDHLAAALSVNRYQMRARVMAITGLTPMAYALQVRLNHARRMITSNEDLPLTVIANRCGFQNLSHFSNSFKQQFGMSPKQYRKSPDNNGS